MNPPMPDFRAHGAPAAATDTSIVLSRDETHHLVTVNRARAGDPVTVFDGAGRQWQCRLTTATRSGATLEIVSAEIAPPLPFQISLAQALPKAGGMEAIIKKATEIGARKIFPLETERTQVHLDAERSDKKHEKWEVAAHEAAKQCGNPWLPEIGALQEFDAFLRAGDDFDLKLVASLHPGAKRLDAWLDAHGATAPRSAVWLIGPEGDFSAAEIERALAAGFQPVTLGPLVLRCETAATYALSILSHEWQRRWPGPAASPHE